ncbi:hypothetical protein LWI28_000470 [Acer negundo]|uniref:RRM domain-containing protein n=1 Tax=Acer negundo TaxID=4023 RepID=A0AAD5JBK9_ACENE|nr:hypothetical protein LWI28_000470 [Acer negundo]
MSRSGQKKEKYAKSGEHSLDNTDQGTAARTRPLSFDEIIIRRKNKKISENVEEGAKEVGNISGDSTVEKVSDHRKSERHHGHKKDSSPGVEKHLSEEVSKVYSRKKKNNTLAKDDNSVRQKDRQSYDSEIKVKDDDSVRQKDRQSYGSEIKFKDENLVSKVYSRKKKDKTLAKDDNSARQKDRQSYDSEIKFKDENLAKDKRRESRESEIRLKDGSLPKQIGRESRESEIRLKDGSLPKQIGRESRESEIRLKDGSLPKQIGRESRESEIRLKDGSLPKQIGRESRESEIRIKDGSLPKQIGRESHGSETKLKTDMKKELFSKAKGKVEKQDLGWGKNHDRLSYDVEDQTAKKHSRDSTGKDRHVDRSGRKSERESKRKYQNEDGERNRDKSDAKKHDLGRGRELQISERKERKESPKSRHTESKLKRRRSRSREREERNRRSISLSPRAHKRTSHYGREHEDLSLQSFKGKSGRQYPDIDRSRVTSNGSSGNYKRHGGSISGLGGYSPRKRKTEAAAKTPSPLNRSPEKKSAKWDVAPVEKDGSFACSVPSNIQTSNQTASSNVNEVVSSTPVTSIAVNPLAGVSYSASLTKQNVSIDSVQLTQATRHMRRLYVENVPASASEKAVMEFLNNILLSSGANYVDGSLPCISCNIQEEKGQALVEFLTPEDASAALSCDGCSFSGCILRIRRPKDFIDMACGEAKKSVAAVGAISDIVQDSPHKIFIGSISKTFSSKMVMEIASAFGPLKSYHFEINEDRDESCAFLEYVDQSVTFKACAGLNGMKLGGQVLTVVQAVPDGSSMENSGDSPFYGIPEHAIPLLEKPTQVIKIKNVFNPEGISSLSELEVEEVLEDVRLECDRFGSVKSIHVVKYEDRHITTLEACEANDNKASAGVKQSLRCDETNEKAETLEVIDHQSRGINGSEFQSEAKEVKEVDEVKESNSIGDKLGDQSGQLDRVDGNMVEDLNRESLSETFSQNVLEQSKNLKGDAHCHDDEVPGNIQTKDMSSDNKPSAEEELNSEEVNRNTQEAVARLDEKEQDDNLARIFEAGSVFVEYRRTEASCMAAHCLHGRLFDDRTVTVEYVPLDLYKSKFPK